MAVLFGEGDEGKGLVPKGVQPFGWEMEAAEEAEGAVVGLRLGKVVGEKLKSHCESMEGLKFRSPAVLAVPPRHLSAEPADRKASQPLLMCLSCPWPAGAEREAEST
jgi:hypothetical protein